MEAQVSHSQLGQPISATVLYIAAFGHHQGCIVEGLWKKRGAIVSAYAQVNMLGHKGECVQAWADLGGQTCCECVLGAKCDAT